MPTGMGLPRRGGMSANSSSSSSSSSTCGFRTQLVPAAAGLLLGALLANIIMLSGKSSPSAAAAAASASPAFADSLRLGDPRTGTPNVPSPDARLVADALREDMANMRQRLQSIENILAEQHLLLQNKPQKLPAGGAGAGGNAGGDKSSVILQFANQAADFSRQARDACRELSAASSGVPALSANDNAGDAAARGSDAKTVMEGQRQANSGYLSEDVRAGRGTQAWRRQQLRRRLQAHVQVQADIRSGARPPRYLRCTLINGWGNVLQEAISCMMLALVSERAILFDYRSVKAYMPFEKFLNPNGYMPYQDAYNFKLMDELRRKEAIIPRHNFTCLDWTADDVASIEAINVHLTYDWWAPNLLVNPILGDRLLAELPRDYYAVVFQFLFKLRADIQRDVDAFKDAFYRGKYVIGLQIRSASSTSASGKIDHKGFPVAEIDLYAQTAHNLEHFQDVVPAEDVRWFVATQNVHMIDYLRQAYGEAKILAVNGTITTTFDAHEEGQRVSLMTWWLLGDADDVLTSEASSFGTTAAVRTGITPIVCNHKNFCSRRLTPTPCQDTKFLVDQPMPCLKELKTMPHHFISSPEATCGYWKHAIYMSKEYQAAQRK